MEQVIQTAASIASDTIEKLGIKDDPAKVGIFQLTLQVLAQDYVNRGPQSPLVSVPQMGGFQGNN